MYSLVFVSIMKLIVPEQMGFYSGIISSVFALANLLGPILGGIITDRTRQVTTIVPLVSRTNE